MKYNYDNMYKYVASYLANSIIKPGARGLWPRAPGFLKLLGPSVGMCACVCPPPRALITSGVI